MYMIVGLGNPGFEYERSRHNAGFMFLDALVEKIAAPAFALQKNVEAQLSKHSNYVLVKPMTFMNDSGKAARAVLEFYKDSIKEGFPNNTIAVYDDLDIEFGSYQIKQATAPKAHNGVLSLTAYLKTNAFWHVRIGVDNRTGDRTIPGSNYVLQHFTIEEQQQLKLLFSTQLLPDFLTRFAQ